MSRTEFPDRVRVKRLHFAEFKCEAMVTRDDGTKTRCNATLTRGRLHFDHDIADGLGGKATFENCRAICRQCHSDKTKNDVAAIAEAKRREARHLGATHPKKPIPSRGFPKSDKPKREGRAMLPPKSLYVEIIR